MPHVELRTNGHWPDAPIVDGHRVEMVTQVDVSMGINGTTVTMELFEPDFDFIGEAKVVHEHSCGCRTPEADTDA